MEGRHSVHGTVGTGSGKGGDGKGGMLTEGNGIVT